MKKTIAILTLTMVSTFAIANWEDTAKNPDITPKYGDGYEFNFTPQGTPAPTVISLDEFYGSNPDVSSSNISTKTTGNATTKSSSLDEISKGNPDLMGC